MQHHSKTIHDSTLKQAPFGRVKGDLSVGASPAVIAFTGEELYPRYIWWSIIGGVCYPFGATATLYT